MLLAEDLTTQNREPLMRASYRGEIENELRLILSEITQLQAPRSLPKAGRTRPPSRDQHPSSGSLLPGCRAGPRRLR